MSTSAQQQYLARVLPWPVDDNDEGYINVHWTFEGTNHRTDKSYPWSGKACRSVAEAVKAIDFNSKRSGTRDLYTCQSRQIHAIEQRGKNNFLWLKAERNQANASYLKSLFIDIDLKDYNNSREDLLAALAVFIQGTGLPKPNVIVDTTGGYHVYWTLAEKLTVAEWLPLAHALVNATKQLNLKCDTQCTIDSARVLRIPDTINFKRNALVRLVLLNDFDFAQERIERSLLPFKVSSASAVHHVNGIKLDPSIFPKLDPITGPSDLSSGIHKPEYPPIKLAEVLDECEFLKDALLTHGANHDNPLWNLTVLATAFVEDGDRIAHLVGKKHPTYTQESTDKLYARKLREKENGVGWPKCQTIHATGSKFCASCKHLKEGKSPLHFRAKKPDPDPDPEPSPDPEPGGSTPPPGVKSTNVLPSNYSRDARGFIQIKVAAADGTTSYSTICEVAMYDAWLQREPWILNFAAEAVPGKAQQIALPFETVGAPTELRKELSRQGITLYDRNIKPVEEFLLSWIAKLKETKDAVVSTAPFGWNTNNGKLEGFVFGGKLFTPTEVRVAQNPDVVTSKGYTPTGDIQPWINAAKLITDQKRPALNAILASSFAAPLVKFTNMRGLMMSCIGESGIGKSTALDTALAVWGHPVRAKNLLHDTDNSVMNKVGELRSLPIFWDDLQPDDTRKYARMVFQMSYGKEKDRMNNLARRRESGTWQTLMVSTSNGSLLDYVTQHTSTTTAGVYRIFEIPVASGRGGPGQIAKTDAARLVGKLDDNYGRIGEKYAEYLGKNFAQIEDEVLDYQKQLDEEINALNEERLWTSLIACVLVGAKIANREGYTQIDEAELRAFMLETLASMREELKSQAVDLTKEINVSNILSNFLNSQRARHTLITNIIHKGKGRPVEGSIKVISDTSKMEAIHVHLGVEDKIIRINSTALSEWLANRELSRHAFTSALKDKYGMKIVNGRIGGGTSFAVNGLLTFMLEMTLTDFYDTVNIDELIKEPGTEPKKEGEENGGEKNSTDVRGSDKDGISVPRAGT